VIGLNVIVTESTGVEKTFLAGALTNKACRERMFTPFTSQYEFLRGLL